MAEQLIDIDYIVENDKPKIYLFIRTDKNKITKIVDNFKPYFFTYSNVFVEPTKSITNIIEGYKSIFGDDLKKIEVKLPKNVEELRGKFLKTFEADILFPLRFLIDRGADFDSSVKLRICYLDIETDDTEVFPNPANPQQKILAISVYDNYTDFCFTFLLAKENKVETKTIKILNEDFKVRIFKFDDERKLIKSFIEFMNDLNFDLITGWNVINFDMAYLLARAKKLKIDIKNFSPIKKVIFKEGKGGTDIVISGRPLLDLYKAYRKLKLSDLKNYTLGYVCLKELGLTKTMPEFKIGKVSEIYKKSIEDFIAYNLTDVILIKKLDEKLNIINYFNEIRCIVGCRFQDLQYVSRLIDILLLKKAKSLGVVLPSKPKEEAKVFRFKGAIVLDPVSGIYENVCVFDFKSLYPSIIQTFNISPETIDKNTDNTGIIPSLFEDLMNLREKYKKLMKENKTDYKIYYNKQFAIKTIINAIYGVLALPTFRLYNVKLASMVTSKGRELLTDLKNFVEGLGYKVLYGDTDSLMVLGEKTEDFFVLEKKINDYFKNKLSGYKNRIKIELDKIFKKIILFKVKKRYVGYVCWRDGAFLETPQYAHVGVESARSDFSDFGEKFQNEIFQILLDGGTKEKVQEVAQNYIKAIKEKKIDLFELALPKKLTRLPSTYETNIQTVRAFLYSNKYLKTNLKVKEKFYLVYVSSTGIYPKTDVVAVPLSFKLPSDFEINYDELIRTNILLKVNNLFQNLGWSFNENCVSNNLNLRWWSNAQVG